MSDELSLHRKTYDEAAHSAIVSQKFNWTNLDAEGEVWRDARGRILGSRDGTIDNDKTLSVTFTRRKVLHKAQTFASADGKAVYIDREFITYFTPGKQRELIVDRPVNDYDKWRFKKEYEAFAAGDSIDAGTPLADLGLQPGDLKALNENGIYTVEALATIPDEVRDFIHNVTDLQGIAERFLKSRTDAGTSAMQARVNAQAAELEELKKVVASLTGKSKAGKKADAAEEPDAAA